MKKSKLFATALSLCATCALWAGSDLLTFPNGTDVFKVCVDKIKSITYAKADDATADDGYTSIVVTTTDGQTTTLPIENQFTVDYERNVAPEVYLELTPKSGSVSIKFTVNEAATSYRYNPHIFALSDIATKSDEELIDLIKSSNNEFTEAATTAIDVDSKTFTYGQYAAVIAAAVGADGEYGAPVVGEFRVAGPYADITVGDVTYNSVNYTVTPSGFISKYVFYWIGPTSSLADYNDDPDEDLGAFAKWIGTNKPGGMRPYWTNKVAVEEATDLTSDTEYTILTIPVTKKSGYIANGTLTKTTVTTKSADEAEPASVDLEIVSSDAYFTKIKYTINDAAKYFYVLVMDEAEWLEYREAHPDETVEETLIANGAKYSSGRTVTWKIGSEKKIVALATAVNDLGTACEAKSLNYTTPAYEMGDAYVNIKVSDVTESSARVVCTPSDDTDYYYQKEAFLSQWDDIATQDGGIYDYTIYNGVQLTGVDDYTFSNLLAEKTHRVYCVAKGKDGKYGQLISAQFEPKEAAGEDSDDYRKFIGTYKMSYTDWLTNETGTFDVTISERVVGKSYNVAGLVSSSIISSWEIDDTSVEGRYEDGKLVIYCGKYMEEIGMKMRKNGFDAVQFCGFTKGDTTTQPLALVTSTAGLTFTYDNGDITVSDNGKYTGTTNELQGFCWMTTSSGKTSGRLDPVIPINLSLKKDSTVETAPRSRWENKASVDIRYRLSSEVIDNYDNVISDKDVVEVDILPMSTLR